MKFTFDYEEILQRRVVIEADCLSDAIKEIESRIENEQIVLCAEDFAGGKISMPLAENTLPNLELYGETVKNKNDLDLVIDYW